MKVENHGTLHRIGLDTEAILSIATSLVYTGKQALALQILSSSIYTPVEAQQYISKIISDMAQATREAEQAKNQEQAPQ